MIKKWMKWGKGVTEYCQNDKKCHNIVRMMLCRLWLETKVQSSNYVKETPTSKIKNWCLLIAKFNGWYGNLLLNFLNKTWIASMFYWKY